jgi:branched-chain amino acid transport system substrate-binding protein
VTVLTASGCTEERLEPRKVPINVYFEGVFMGPLGYYGLHALQGAQLRVDELNRDPGFPAELTLKRINSKNEFVIETGAAERAVDDPRSVAVIGPLFSGESGYVGGGFEKAGIPFITPSADDPDLAKNGWDYWYRTIANRDDPGASIGELMAREFREIYVVHDESEYGVGLAQDVAHVAKQAGTNVVAFEGLEASGGQGGLAYYSSLIDDIGRSRAEAVFYAGCGDDAGAIVALARTAGIRVPMWSGDCALEEAFLSAAGDDATNVVLACLCNLEGEGSFLATYEARYGKTEVPLHAAEAYDIASLVGAGIQVAFAGGARTPEAIRAGIKAYLDGLTRQAPFEGVAKDIAFDPESHELDVSDRRELVFIYSVTPGEISLEGTAAELLRD